MARLTLRDIEFARRLLGLPRSVEKSALRNVELILHGARVKFTPEERELLIAAEYLNNPFGYRVDLTRPAGLGNPWLGRGDLPGIDTPDAKSFAERVMRLVDEKMRQLMLLRSQRAGRLGGKGRQTTLLEYLGRRPAPPRRERTAVSRQAVAAAGASAATPVQRTAVQTRPPAAKPQPSQAQRVDVERFIRYTEWLISSTERGMERQRQAARGPAGLAEYARLLTAYAERLHAQLERGNKLYAETRDKTYAPSTREIEEMMKAAENKYTPPWLLEEKPPERWELAEMEYAGLPA